MTGKCKSGTFSSSGVERMNKNLVVKASLRAAVINRAEEEDPGKKTVYCKPPKKQPKRRRRREKTVALDNYERKLGERSSSSFWKHAALHFSKLSDSLTSNKLLSG